MLTLEGNIRSLGRAFTNSTRRGAFMEEFFRMTNSPLDFRIPFGYTSINESHSVIEEVSHAPTPRPGTSRPRSRSARPAACSPQCESETLARSTLPISPCGPAARDRQLAVVSQASARLRVARVNEKARAFVPGSGAVYRFRARATAMSRGSPGYNLIAV